jgi:hypothetical protein
VTRLLDVFRRLDDVVKGHVDFVSHSCRVVSFDPGKYKAGSNRGNPRRVVRLGVEP